MLNIIGGNVKKKILSGMLIAVFVVAGTASAKVGAEPPTTAVTGVVTKNQTAVANADVSVQCNGHTEMDTTDNKGSYLATFAAADCPFGSTVKVVAKKGGESGVASGTVQGVTTKLNLSIVNVEVPEYGLISALTAGGIGIGLIAYMRRREQLQSGF